jgi:hypothetical protein
MQRAACADRPGRVRNACAGLFAAGASFGLIAATGAAVANPALGEQLRKSPVSDMAARATTVADQLAIRRFGPGAVNNGPATYNGVGFVLPRNRWGGWYPHPYADQGWGWNNSGWQHSGWQGDWSHQHYSSDPNGGNGSFPGDGDPRMRRNFDPDHYDDPKPHDHRFDRFGGGSGFRIGFNTGFSTGYSTGIATGGWNGVGTVWGDPFGFDPYWGNGWAGWRWNRPWWLDPFPYGVDGRLVQPGSTLQMPAPTNAAQSSPSAPPETDIDAARRLVSNEVYEAAVERYRMHLAENPDDFEVMAELSLALAGAGRFDDATAMARLAYERDPTLANRPLDERVAIDSRELRKIVVRAVRSAHDRDSASGWLLVTVLMQAENRDPVGLRMLDRAADRGLDAGVVDALRVALR